MSKGMCFARRAGLGTVALLMASLAAHAAEAPQELGTMVVTAAGFEQKIADAPASISVITREDLQKRPYMTLLDAVRDLEGVDVGETRDKTGQGTISMRGMGSDYTLILVNGRRQNNHGDIYPNSFGGNQFNHIPPLDAIARVEIIRGPAATLYGADALGGVINIITRKDAEKWGGSFSIGRTVQSDNDWGDSMTGDVYISGPLLPGKLNLSLRGSWYERNESSPTYETATDPSGATHTFSLGFGGGGKSVDNENLGAGFSLAWTPVENQTVTLDYDTSRQKYDNEIKTDDAGNLVYPVGTVDNINSIWAAGNVCIGATGNAATCAANGGTWSRRANPRAGYSATQEFTRESWSLGHEGAWGFGNSFVSLSHVATNNDGRTLPFTVAERQQLLEMIDGTGAYAGMSVDDRKALAEATFLPRGKRTLESRQYTLDGRVDIPFELAGWHHNAVIGMQVVRGELEDGIFGMESGQTGGVQDHNTWALFAEDTWHILDSLSLTGGLRYDEHSVFGEQLSPRLYAVYALNDQFTLKGGVTTGYKAPKTTQLYDGITGFGGQGVSPMYGNPDLKPETSVSTEVAVYWQHPVARHSFNVTLFQNDFKDKISNQPCGNPGEQSCGATGDYAALGYTPSSSRATNIDEVVLQGIEVAGRYQLPWGVALRGNYTLTDSEQKSGANKGRPLGNSAKHECVKYFV
ncbi:TonB-dependent receptor domain-containing protein [Chrysiogenes arsenatis]|uniref:TonB-dependent receptor domain-containing protein n=1 Tax=Chrysiogenes arsenatis TaxID=309797 RepID=UPI0004078ABC|nr:TonB-dependent receptor [Chrysiogenes arsenatis]